MKRMGALYLLAVAMLCLATSAQLIPSACAAEAAPTATPLQLAKQLDSNSFEDRENATLALIKLGIPAIAAVEQQFVEGSLEATTRGLYVLTQLALSSDEATHEAARMALEKVADSDRGAISRRAATAVHNLNEQRREQTLSQLGKLGARITRRGEEDVHFGSLVLGSDAIEIGPDFEGDLKKDLRLLRWLSDVDRVILVGDKITDEVMSDVAAMRGLKSLHLYATQVTDLGMASLKSLTSLQLVGIYYTPITDAAIKSFEPLKALEGMKLYGTKITTVGVEQVKKDRVIPIGVDLRRGAFLGIGCDTIGESCVISTVHPDGPASQGGIMPEDVVVSFGGLDVTSFETLTAHISKRIEGEVVRMKLMRPQFDDDMRDKDVSVDITLGKWDLSNCIRNGIRP
ncbi:PDZ/DHR/GLGF domain protein [Pirellula staleyi DSM 6068]|uniref:PDZ/DHR/GLGF domain protein n=1 Tax=Pirellula staleyi (strain ATCC 27377 / DSM 6068 / ICPB 4128) TaxID=530564 RepID=D2QWD1_PIRSD|nr:PDZ domain-containing protein [Pirellula staleyi]ADB16006.1 PDZ/DHR/GLGF domain protein [Pirellula staleyi DSM 6068]